MKYLESFDLFGDGEYEKMTRGRFMDAMSKMGNVDLSEEKRIKLSKLFQGSSVVLHDFSAYEWWPDHLFCQPTENKWFFMYPFYDEWYFIEIYNKQIGRGEYYKCDGLDGIKKMLNDTFEVNEASIADLIKDLPKELTPPPADPDVKLVSQHTCKQRWNGKKLLFKIKWYNTAEHDLTKRIAERTSFQSIKHFNEIFKRFLDKIFPSMIGKEILVSGRYSFYFEEYNVSIIVVIDVDNIMKNNKNEILVITILSGDVGINVVKTIVIPEL